VIVIIGERLAKLRKAKKLTQDELGNQLGISKYRMSMYENNKHTPSEEVIVSLAKYFDVSIDYLAGLIDEPYSYHREDDVYVLKISKATPEIVVNVFTELVEISNSKFTV